MTVGGIMAVAGLVPMDFVIPEDRSEFNIWLKMPLGSTLEQTAARRVERVEQAVAPGHPEVRVVFATVGSVRAEARERVAHLRGARATRASASH